MRKGDSLHQSIPLNSLNDCDTSLKLSRAVIQTFFGGTSDEKWFNKVEELVNWVLDNDMYCIINLHYDYLGKS